MAESSSVVGDMFAKYFWYQGDQIRLKFADLDKEKQGRSPDITKELLFEGYDADAAVDSATQQLILKSWKAILAGETDPLRKRAKGSSPIAMFYEVSACLLDTLDCVC